MNVKAVHVISCVTTLRVHLSVLVEMDMRSLMREAVIVSDVSQWLRNRGGHGHPKFI